MLTQVSISAFPVRGYSIAEDVVGVNTLVQPPWLSREGPQAPGKITTTNLRRMFLVVIYTAVDTGR